MISVKLPEKVPYIEVSLLACSKSIYTSIRAEPYGIDNGRPMVRSKLIEYCGHPKIISKLINNIDISRVNNDLSLFVATIANLLIYYSLYMILNVILGRLVFNY